MIVDEYVLGNDDLEQYVEDYLYAQATLQTITNPSGAFLPSGVGLGEPKYMVDGSRFNGAVSFIISLFPPWPGSFSPAGPKSRVAPFIPRGLFFARKELKNYEDK